MNFTKSILAKILVHFPVSVIRLRYLLRFKRLPNLKDPRNLNEKILYQKLYTDTSAWSMLADKVQVREYIKKCGLENTLTKLYAVWDDAADIQFENLPDAFMLKSNNGDGKGGIYIAAQIQRAKNRVSADHDDIAMCKVQQLCDAVYHGIAERDQRVYGAEA